ncbi:hypothetical protein EPUS_09105 [Endocarpon pusillum Z07020]|uniref:AB hydrolase-1 domain-containing protein n=1 Tax=Endocarpon pusillum (strain Z07020 / HMAS-L-300199) TaxID=1263415 RepID=U1FZA9_ENDPU|nr:uncharacterized protein EPUS_09105 [Endocarpon pusillum Z07020]ERF70267.1 hypothetical protein EPUS_09105 [Endocarpon pusillum Z07020]
MFWVLAAVPFFLFLFSGSALSQSTPNRSIEWFPCTLDIEGTPSTCGTLAVPLDYTEQGSERLLNLSLIKVNATKEPFKGSVMFNPGGPGYPVRSILAGRSGEFFLNGTGGNFDLISFDPRCYDSSVDLQNILLLTPLSSLSSDTAVGTAWAYKRTLAETCYENRKDIGDLIGTAFVARDMMQIVDALGEDGMLRYWGFSYGSVLGATVAAMFPDRMDKVVLDGVLNLHQYYAGRDVEQLIAADESFNGFIEACVSSPETCILAREGITAQTLSTEINQLLETIKYRPLGLGSNNTNDVVEYDLTEGLIINGLRTPSTSWPALAGYFDAILKRNLTAYHEFRDTLLGGSISAAFAVDANPGIRCSDVSLRTDNLTGLLPLIEEFQNTSRFGGGILAVAQPITCAQWRFQAKERYEGDFQVQTKNPILLVGSPFDHITPLASAQNHCSIGQPSLCTYKAIREYFINGTLPDTGTQCDPDVTDFGKSSSTLSKRAAQDSEDAVLLNAALSVSQDLLQRFRLF